MEQELQGSSKATAAFLRYARHGFHKRSLSDFDMIDCIRGSTASREEARDMLAVYDTLRMLRYMGKRETLRAVYEVYFVRQGRRLRKNDISLRVRRFAAENFWDDRTVYRRLSAVKRLFLTILADL